ncbi:MAG TPA: aminodeoxychorismate/anthranilate synthase component II [Actinomycetota bacterium]|nr:aminodeoxychorismate/anthranilate synthase component II [Actinomycetota bacterium]
MGARVLLLDNFDSFTYNIAQYLGDAGAEPVVVRANATLEDLDATGPDALVISPGPGRPEDAGCSVAAVRHFAGRIPVLGVCLGHQAIGTAYGGVVVRAGRVMHGKTSEVFHDGAGLFVGLPNPLVATRYHSLVIERSSLPAELAITAETTDGVIMGVRHRELGVEGVQFHPESALTPDGIGMIEQFLRG